ncbi:STAS domain-containing protein [Actinophytocola sp.]|uniref:STAS domain-containing protein n=1 Tax=Actinophytocola sp. TaxID=1872138 RepID=UPI002ED49ECC
MSYQDWQRSYLRVDRRSEGRAVVVRVIGEVDVDTVPLLDDQLCIATDLAIPPAPVIADLRDVHFFGSKGIAALVGAQQRCQRRRTALRVLVSAPVMRPISVLGLTDEFTLCRTLTAALHYH